MEGLVYLSVRVGCAAYLLYKVWGQKKKVHELCDLLCKHSINSPFHSKNVILLL